MLGFLRVHAPGRLEKFCQHYPLGGGNAGSLQCELSTVVQRLLLPAGRPREEHGSLYLGLRLSIEPFFWTAGVHSG